MPLELMYTSAPQGLKPGSKGYCTVAMTSGMPPALVQRLENLSGYRPALPSSVPVEKHPVNHAFTRFSLGGQEYFVLSRVCFSGLDYTKRNNKFAHHIALTQNELPPAGPAWLAMQPGFFEETWTGKPRLLPPDRIKVPHSSSVHGPAKHWAELGDPGWAGYLAAYALKNPRAAIVLVEQSEQQGRILGLMADAISLIPERARWKAEFSTYVTESPSGNFPWRGVLAGSPLLAECMRNRANQIVTLEQLGPLPEDRLFDDRADAWIAYARTGEARMSASDSSISNVPLLEHAETIDASVLPNGVPPEDSARPLPIRAPKKSNDLTLQAIEQKIVVTNMEARRTKSFLSAPILAATILLAIIGAVAFWQLTSHTEETISDNSSTKNSLKPQRASSFAAEIRRLTDSGNLKEATEFIGKMKRDDPTLLSDPRVRDAIEEHERANKEAERTLTLETLFKKSEEVSPLDGRHASLLKEAESLAETMDEKAKVASWKARVEAAVAREKNERLAESQLANAKKVISDLANEKDPKAIRDLLSRLEVEIGSLEKLKSLPKELNDYVQDLKKRSVVEKERLAKLEKETVAQEAARKALENFKVPPSPKGPNPDEIVIPILEGRIETIKAPGEGWTLLPIKLNVDALKDSGIQIKPQDKEDNSREIYDETKRRITIKQTQDQSVQIKFVVPAQSVGRRGSSPDPFERVKIELEWKNTKTNEVKGEKRIFFKRPNEMQLAEQHFDRLQGEALAINIKLEEDEKEIKTLEMSSESNKKKRDDSEKRRLSILREASIGIGGDMNEVIMRLRERTDRKPVQNEFLRLTDQIASLNSKIDEDAKRIETLNSLSKYDKGRLKKIEDELSRLGEELETMLQGAEREQDPKQDKTGASRIDPTGLANEDTKAGDGK